MKNAMVQANSCKTSKNFIYVQVLPNISQKRQLTFMALTNAFILSNLHLSHLYNRAVEVKGLAMAAYWLRDSISQTSGQKSNVLITELLPPQILPSCPCQKINRNNLAGLYKKKWHSPLSKMCKLKYPDPSLSFTVDSLQLLQCLNHLRTYFSSYWSTLGGHNLPAVCHRILVKIHALVASNV